MDGEADGAEVEAVGEGRGAAEVAGAEGSTEADGSGAATVGLGRVCGGADVSGAEGSGSLDSVTVTVGSGVGSAVGTAFAGAGSLTCPIVVPSSPESARPDASSIPVTAAAANAKAASAPTTMPAQLSRRGWGGDATNGVGEGAGDEEMTW